MEAAHTSWRSLGEVFVDRGLISEADLERALAEQVATKRRLADILVRRGLVTGHDITNALMEQLGSKIPMPPRPIPTTAPAPAAAAPAPEPARQPDSPIELSVSPHALVAEAEARRRGAEADLAAARDAHTQVLRGLEQVRAELDARDLRSDSLATGLVETQARLRKREGELADTVAGWEEARREAERYGSQLLELELRLEEKENELAEASASVAAWTARSDELAAEADALAERVGAAVAALEDLARARFTAADAKHSRQAAPVEGVSRTRAADQTGVLYFVPNAEGYDLVERDGELPSVGESLEFGDQRYVVTKLGRSPLPFDRRGCVFLTAV